MKNGWNYEQFCAADIKIGENTVDTKYDPVKILEKRIKSFKKFPALQHLGFQFIGICKYPEDKLTREFCRSFAFDDYMEVFELFLGKNVNSDRQKIIKYYVDRLDRLIAWFRKQKSIQFVSSSVFMCYCSKSNRMDLRMIDFAHTYYEDGMDENYIDGIVNLKKWFSRLL